MNLKDLRVQLGKFCDLASDAFEMLASADDHIQDVITDDKFHLYTSSEKEEMLKEAKGEIIKAISLSKRVIAGLPPLQEALSQYKPKPKTKRKK